MPPLRKSTWQVSQGHTFRSNTYTKDSSFGIDLQKLLSGEDLSEEETKLLKKLTEEPTSVSADLLPIRSSLQPFGGQALNPIPLGSGSTSQNTEFRTEQPIKVKSAPNTFVSLGFDPTALEPESGFKPITEGQGSSIPTLAFSVLDGAERPPVSPGLYQTVRPQILPVEPLNPSSVGSQKHSSVPTSADFHSFADTAFEDDIYDDEYQYDVGFVETDRIDVQDDPSAVLYSQQAAPYGEQFPSYFPQTIETRVGSADSLSKTLVAGDSVVYGKVPPSDNAEYYLYDYEDEFYYDDDDSSLESNSQLNSRLGIAAISANGRDDQDQKPMSFFQLLNNLNGSPSSSS